MKMNLYGELFFRLKNNIKVYKNVLTESERKQLLKISKKYIKKIEVRRGPLVDVHPGLQSENTIEIYLRSRGEGHLIDKIVKKAKLHKLKVNYRTFWFNYSDPSMDYINWHSHGPNTQIGLVYYLENPENLGTMFKIDGKEYQIKGEENSVIVFDTRIEHTFPNNVTLPRTSVAMDFYV